MSRSPDTLLEGTWFAAEMPPDIRRRLGEIGEIVEYPALATLVVAGSPCPAMGVIIDGRVALRPAVPGLAPETMLTLEAGDVFGWSAVMHGSVATADAIALVPTTAVLFERQRLGVALAGDCELAAAVYRRVLAAVARRLQVTRLQLLDLYRAGAEPW
jgi:CRP/FNR family cyclic AMP-dependent transcriptional regulator